MIQKSDLIPQAAKEARQLRRRMSMIQKKDLARQAVKEALQLRKRHGYNLWDAICVYDMIDDKIGIELRFVDAPSLEGMYMSAPTQCIVVSAHRPPGRQAYTSAHELGHHIFKHGTKVDLEKIESNLIPEQQNDPDEFLADCFAEFLLMPKVAISKAFTTRGWKADCCTPTEFYILSGYFGVGYSTLISHMSYNLRLLDPCKAKELMKEHPRNIRATLLERDIQENLIIVDTHWGERAIDIQVGDFILLPSGTSCDKNCVALTERDKKGDLYRGVTSGTGRFTWDTSAAYVRVSRRNFIGRSIYRHLEEIDD